MKVGSLSCLVYLMPLVELRISVEVLVGLSSLCVVPVGCLWLQGRFLPVGLQWCVLVVCLLQSSLGFVLPSWERWFACRLMLGVQRVVVPIHMPHLLIGAAFGLH